MKKFFVCLIALCFCLILAGCQDSPFNTNPDKHHHEYSNSWYMDSEYHWKECSCGNKDLLAEHSYGTDNKCVTCQYLFYSTSGLTFTPIKNGTEYEVTGIDATQLFKQIELIIPKYYNDKPVTSVGELAFDNGRMYRVQLPDTITNIGKSAFAYCPNLTSINIPENCVTIGNYAFNTCRKLVVTQIPDSVTSLGEGAFYECDSITEIRLSKSLTEISKELFAGCNNLIQVNIPEGITTINQGAFILCGFSTINLPSTLKKIDYQAFRRCDLQQIEIPEAVETIGANAFEWCSQLKTVKLSKNLQYIFRKAFMDCTSLTTITIPENVLYIGASAFLGCNSLNSVVIENPYGWVAEKYNATVKVMEATEMGTPSVVATLFKSYTSNMDYDFVRK